MEKVCQCCRTGTLGLNGYGWLGVGISRCWAVTLHVPRVPSSIRAAPGRRHRHFCTPEFLQLVLYQAHVPFSFMSQMLMEHRECLSWLQLLGEDVGWEASLCSVLPCHTCCAVLTSSAALCVLLAPDTRPLARSIPVLASWAEGAGHGAQLLQLRAGSPCSCLLFCWAPRALSERRPE